MDRQPQGGLTDPQESRRPFIAVVSEVKAGGLAPKAVLIALASFVDPRKAVLKCYPSLQTLAARAECSRRTVRRAIRTLEQEGLVVSSPKMRGRGGYGASLYTLCIPGTWAGKHGSAPRPDRVSARDRTEGPFRPDRGTARDRTEGPFRPDRGTARDRTEGPPEVSSRKYPEKYPEDKKPPYVPPAANASREPLGGARSARSSELEHISRLTDFLTENENGKREADA